MLSTTLSLSFSLSHFLGHHPTSILFSSLVPQPPPDMTRDTDATRMDKASSESAPENDNDLDQDMDMEMEMDTTQQQQQPQSEDNPSLIRRKRLTQACDPCRKKKIKCGKERMKKKRQWRYC